MTSEIRWRWTLPGLLFTTACMAQAGTGPIRAQLKAMQQNLSLQQSKIKELQQQVDELKQRNASGEADLAKRDREIARLKVQLAKQGALQSALSSAPSSK